LRRHTSVNTIGNRSLRGKWETEQAQGLKGRGRSLMPWKEKEKEGNKDVAED